MRPILVGMANPYRCPPLSPYPGSAGRRLQVMSGLTEAEYTHAFRRVNLCVRTWRLVTAVRSARKILAARSAAPVVVLGAAAWAAFCVGPHPRSGGSVTVGRRQLYYLPHPSGQNVVFNDPRQRARARRLLRRLARGG